MIAAKENAPKLTPAEYFAWEERQLEKHEYIDGEVYGMSGGSRNHSLISVRFITLFSNHLETSGGETGNSDLRVNAAGTNNYTYPDVSVTCDDRDKITTQYITYPCLIVEVLSPSTEAYDRGGKFRLYRHNPNLQDYLLVSSNSIEIDLYQGITIPGGSLLVINSGLCLIPWWLLSRKIKVSRASSSRNNGGGGRLERLETQCSWLIAHNWRSPLSPLSPPSQKLNGKGN